MKKFISVILAFLLSLSACSALAAEEAFQGENLIPEGSFDTPEDLKRFQNMHGILPKWVEEGATDTPGACMMTNAASGRYITWHVMTLRGETYRVSFYAKCGGKATNFTLYTPFHDTDGGFNTIASQVPISTEWQKYEFIWTPEKDSKGNLVDGPCQISLRTNNSNDVTESLWLDEIEIVPQGKMNVKYNDKRTYKGDWKDPLSPEKDIHTVRFSDCVDHWSEGTVTALASNGILNGVGDNLYLPDETVTRAEYVTMIMNSFYLSDVEYTGAYQDVSAGAYYANAVQAAKQLQLISPAMTTADMFRPEKEITREEAAYIVANAVKLKNSQPEKTEVSFIDSDKISVWAKNAVMYAAETGLIVGHNGMFRPQDTLTRAEAATLLMRLVEAENRLAVFVDYENGLDTNNGTATAPVKTVDAARNIVRQHNSNMKNHIYVLLKNGEHYVPDTIAFDAKDSGVNGYNVVYTSYGAEKASLSMGVHYTGFNLYDAEKNIYRVKVGDTVARQVYINGVRAIRARSEGDGGLKDATLEIGYGHTTTDTSLASYAHPEDLEFVYYQDWTQPRGHMDSYEVKDGVLHITMDKTWWPIASNKGGTSVKLPVYIENAYELLDRPGEWYINIHDGYLYYMPRPFENPKALTATLPVGERMITMTGTPEDVVHNVVFDRIDITYTSWMEPTEYGVAESQNTIQQVGTKGMIQSAVRIHNGRYIDFTNCTFKKLGASALQMFDTIQDCNVIGNEFYDVSGSAINLGQTAAVNGKNATQRQHINPVEYKYFVVNNTISNNYIHDVALDYGSCAAISAAFPKDSTISHNDIGNVIYSGMHLGWGWDSYRFMRTAMNNFVVENNYVYEVLNDKIFDGGAIYTIGASGGSRELPNIMRGNYLQNQRNAGAFFYTDEGTTYWTIEGNVTDAKEVEYWNARNRDWVINNVKFYRSSIQNNVSRNNYSNVPHSDCVEGNKAYDNTIVDPDEPWPTGAQAIIDNSGITAVELAKYPEKIRYARGTFETLVPLGEARKMPVTVFGRKAERYEVPENAYYTSSDPNVATVDSDGNITAHQVGMAEISVFFPVGDRVVKAKTMAVCGEYVESASIGFEKLNMMEGYQITLKPEVVTTVGRTKKATATYTVDNSKLISIDGNVLTAKATGKTVLHATLTYGEETVSMDCPIEIKRISNPETANIPANKPDASFFRPGNWSFGPVGVGNGVKLNTPGSESLNKSKMYEGFINFDIIVDETTTSGWPSFALSADGKGYGSGNIYMIGFKKDIIEVQRFNNGQRTVLFGEIDGFTSIGGNNINVKGIFEWGKRHNITVGTEPAENGTRIVLNIDGQNIFDYVDSEAGYITGGYYPIVYARTSDISLLPSEK